MFSMTTSFIYDASMPRVVFGTGALSQLPDEMDRLGAKRAIVLCTPGQVEDAHRVAALLGSRAAPIFPQASMHVPMETARLARAAATEAGADCAVAVGGGSTIGLGKAIALDSGLPIIAIPTTYAGSEMTPIYGLTMQGVKKTGRDARVLPRVVLYDPLLTLSLPREMTITSAFNAIAHAAEGLYAEDRNPLTSLMAEEGIRAMTSALCSLGEGTMDTAARIEALYGAWLCGVVLGRLAMGLHHKLCHTLGGSFNLPHAEVHTVILPHALAYNAAHAPEATKRIARSLDVEASDVPSALVGLARRLGAPVALKDLGMPLDGLERAADLASQDQYPNPRPLERKALLALLCRAYDGAPPLA
jgi:alcohol dehydrogenase class IV